MATIGSTKVGTAGGGGTPIGPSGSPKIYNVDVVTASTEVSQALTSNTKQFTIRVRGSANLQLAFIATESSSNFITVPSGTTLIQDGLDFSGTLYFQTDKASQKVEILEWS